MLRCCQFVSCAVVCLLPVGDDIVELGSGCHYVPGRLSLSRTVTSPLLMLTTLSPGSFSLRLGEQEEQRRTRSLSQLSLTNGATGRRKEGSVLFGPGDGPVDTEKEILAASERRRMTARYSGVLYWVCLCIGCV